MKYNIGDTILINNNEWIISEHRMARGREWMYLLSHEDINALIKVAESMDLEVEVLRGAWQTNLEVRPECDWKELRGRAVVEEKA